MFIPKIVRWGMKYGAINLKKDRHFQAMQWGTGGNNSVTHKRQGGKTYRNAKLNRLGRVKLFADINRKGVKR